MNQARHVEPILYFPRSREAVDCIGVSKEDISKGNKNSGKKQYAEERVSSIAVNANPLYLN